MRWTAAGMQSKMRRCESDVRYEMQRRRGRGGVVDGATAIPPENDLKELELKLQQKALRLGKTSVNKVGKNESEKSRKEKWRFDGPSYSRRSHFLCYLPNQDSPHPRVAPLAAVAHRRNIVQLTLSPTFLRHFLRLTVLLTSSSPAGDSIHKFFYRSSPRSSPCPRQGPIASQARKRKKKKLGLPIQLTRLPKSL